MFVHHSLFWMCSFFLVKHFIFHLNFFFLPRILLSLKCPVPDLSCNCTSPPASRCQPSSNSQWQFRRSVCPFQRFHRIYQSPLPRFSRNSLPNSRNPSSIAWHPCCTWPTRGFSANSTTTIHSCRPKTNIRSHPDCHSDILPFSSFGISSCPSCRQLDSYCHERIPGDGSISCRATEISRICPTNSGPYCHFFSTLPQIFCLNNIFLYKKLNAIKLLIGLYLKEVIIIFARVNLTVALP